ncbi:rod shape-determining protein [Actinoplanes sp. KI2]|uniref:rod shape-determining protein n=1 Tax=Actinoplanes sp. KI2 TaxID=2983315 RepID=UPI0021D5D817|nr:rod shape-determining protein [Actinoplanes sp. KI2]MCU7730323.1 rod shape-determining protein [Actinoplanes sp. KI2]
MSVFTTIASGRYPCNGPVSESPAETQASAETSPTVVAAILGSGRTQVWVPGRGSLTCPSGNTVGTSHAPVRRGRVADRLGCVDLLADLIRRYRDPIPAGSVVVVCRPVLATMAEQHVLRQVATAVFVPSRVLFIDTVRAAAIGAGGAAGALLIADIGAELIEVAALQHGRVKAARRMDLGTRDLKRGAPIEALAHATTRMVNELRLEPATKALVTAALTRGLMVVGDGALIPSLMLQITADLRIPVRSAAAPRTAALNGAGLAAMAAARDPSSR